MDGTRTRDRKRSRSRSPVAPHKSRNDKGFRWKNSNKTSHNSDFRETRSSRQEHRSAYSPDKKLPEDRDRRHDRDQRQREDEEREKDLKAMRDGEANVVEDEDQSAPAKIQSNVGPDTGVDIASKFGARAAAKFSKDPASSKLMDPPVSNGSASSSSKPKKSQRSSGTSAAPVAAAGPMILVTVNDRLGTKAQIPCLPSDSIADFKKIVAMKIGRRPHEILIKRQSERPFKDFLTLQDYGVNSGVQLDLELDTGD